MGLVNDALLQMFFSVERFAALGLGVQLRPYQSEIAAAVVDSVLNSRGLAIVAMVSRQGGKNETSAIVESYLLNLFQRAGGCIVKTAPTQEQAMISADRVSRLLKTRWTSGARRAGNKVTLGNASAVFLSAGGSVVGNTASLLLECDESQDVDRDTWQKNFVPMAASTNATTVFWGTAWSKSDLLGLMRSTLGARERADGIRRVYCYPWQHVAKSVPLYRAHVDEQKRVLGEDNPLFLSQYSLVEVAELAGMFPPDVRAGMCGTHARHQEPVAECVYYFSIDVGGEDRDAGDGSDHDATAVTIWCRQWGGFGWRWLVVNRLRWVGIAPYDVVANAVNVWRPAAIVVDATGIGAGLASHLAGLHPNVLPFVFGSASKSKLGWDFLGMCRTGRVLDHVADGTAEQGIFRSELERAQMEVRPGPGRLIKWGVPESNGHDDMLISCALVAELDACAPAPYADSVLIPAVDPLVEMDRRTR